MAIVTISRKVGSLGDEIAQQAAKQLGIKVIGGADIHRLALECDKELSDVCRTFETEMPAGFFERIFFRDPAGSSLFASLVYQQAAMGDAVILGRGAQIVLAKQPAVLKARIVAPFRVRVERVAQRKGISQDDAADYVRRYDRQRRSLIESIFQVDLNDWSLYDMVLNTTDLPQKLVVDTICLAARELGPISDQQKAVFAGLALAKEVEALIKKKVPTFPARDVEVESLGQGRLVLTGAVLDKEAVKRAGKIAAAHAGVTEVDNQLLSTDITF
ncbi:MAG: cytidylate kinase family protein [Proteobacteria bacterium]|nr:cytidylate kinase family protein [Pseudomonadota bacterium]MBU2467792.1 cytidylate kinase family protein [Pseudomonadota bacterium]MBU2517808.1 cytidylate kinase family protein [Pseudomonadota bacterium]